MGTGYLIPSPWERAGVSEPIWKQAPHHAFRKGFKSEMLRAGAPADAVDFLQGHVTRGGRGRYIDMERAFDWDEVLGMIPAMGRGALTLGRASLADSR